MDQLPEANSRRPCHPRVRLRQFVPKAAKRGARASPKGRPNPSPRAPPATPANTWRPCSGSAEGRATTALRTSTGGFCFLPYAPRFLPGSWRFPPRAGVSSPEVGDSSPGVGVSSPGNNVSEPDYEVRMPDNTLKFSNLCKRRPFCSFLGHFLLPNREIG